MQWVILCFWKGLEGEKLVWLELMKEEVAALLGGKENGVEKMMKWQ